jgi:nicotinate phosphoribosyltransferase
MSFGLYTDLYELTMAAGYWRAGMTGPATFELFVRHLPPPRAYLIAAGLEPALDCLEALAFDRAEIDWLRELPQFAHVPAAFFDDYLRGLTFTGDIWAVPEGTAVFANEPLVRVTAPLPEAQLVETLLLAMVSFQTSVATKAARLVEAAAGRPVIEFGARRAHGVGSAIDAARASYIGGCDGTSFVEAGRRFGIPVSGTMAHSWVQAFPTEAGAFKEFSRTFEAAAVFLLDTYDTLAAVRGLVASGVRPPMVRLDSGDLARLSVEVRRILDEAGFHATKIFATSDLDEYEIERLVSAGAPIDGFGVGTSLTTVNDAPALGAVYKLVEVDRGQGPVGVVKLSAHKQTWPGAKQVWRIVDGGEWLRDVVAAAGEPAPPNGLPLLEPVMTRGRRLEPKARLADARARCQATRAELPRGLRGLKTDARYPVVVSDTLESRRRALTRAAIPGR